MKRYTLCTILFACVACCAQGCGKNDYNAFQSNYADCTNSGGTVIEVSETGEIVCQCKNPDGIMITCSNLPCNQKDGGCGECTDGNQKCFFDDKNQYKICEGKKWRDTGKTCNTNSNVTCEGEENRCNEEGDQISCIDGKQYIFKCDNKGCKDGKCITQCTNNSRTCNEEYLEICDDGTLERIFCPFGCDKEKKECKESKTATCNNDEWKCEVNALNHPVLYQCIDNKWEVERICEYDTCDVQKKSCGCDVDKVICSDDGQSVMRCNESAIAGYTIKEKITNCENGCKEGQCKCAEGTKRCADNTLEECRDGKWQVLEQCDLYCTNGECKECSDGATQCSADNKYVQQCVNGQWIDADEPCKFGCNEARRECNECNDNEYICKENKRYICKDGSYILENNCEDNGCNPLTNNCNQCPINTYSCINNNSYLCDHKTGNWSLESECEHQCNTNNGVCDKCDRDDKICINKELYNCNDGDWSFAEVCEYGCNATEKRCNECTPLTNQCNENGDIQKCKENGTKGELIKCKNGCADGECKCEDNTRRCIENQIQTCQNGEWNNVPDELIKVLEDSTEQKIYCSISKDAIEYCENGTLKSKDCPLGCTQGECNECVNVETQCSFKDQSVNQYTELKCVDGQWKDNDCNLPNICYNDKCTVPAFGLKGGLYEDMVVCYNNKYGNELYQVSNNQLIYLNQKCAFDPCTKCKANTFCIDDKNKLAINNKISICNDTCTDILVDSVSFVKLCNSSNKSPICYYGIDDKKCYNSCAPGKHRCNGNVLERCDGYYTINNKMPPPWTIVNECNAGTECSAKHKGCIKYSPNLTECTNDVSCNDEKKELSTCITLNNINKFVSINCPNYYFCDSKANSCSNMISIAPIE